MSKKKQAKRARENANLWIGVAVMLGAAMEDDAQLRERCIEVFESRGFIRSS